MRICKVVGCTNKHHSNGLCNKHRRQLKRHGKILERTRYDPNEIIIKGDIAEIVLYNNDSQEVARAKIDAEDVPKIEKYKWYFHKGTGKSNYAATSIGNPKKVLILSNVVMENENNPSVIYDHKNRDGLNNYKSNLRKCTHRQNIQNRSRLCNNKSGYKGVSWCKDKKKWLAQIIANKKHYFLGRYIEKKDAARAYNKKAIELHGEFAYLNKV